MHVIWLRHWALTVLPVLPVLLRVFLRHRGEWVDDAVRFRRLIVDDFLEQNLDGLVSPAVAILREQRLHVAALEIRKLPRKTRTSRRPSPSPAPT